MRTLYPLDSSRRRRIGRDICGRRINLARHNRLCSPVRWRRSTNARCYRPSQLPGVHFLCRYRRHLGGGLGGCSLHPLQAPPLDFSSQRPGAKCSRTSSSRRPTTKKQHCLGLQAVGLRRIGDLMPIPRAALADRFGSEVADRRSSFWRSPRTDLSIAPASLGMHV